MEQIQSPYKMSLTWKYAPTLCPILYVEQHDKCLIHHCRRTVIHIQMKRHINILLKEISQVLYIYLQEKTQLFCGL